MRRFVLFLTALLVVFALVVIQSSPVVQANPPIDSEACQRLADSISTKMMILDYGMTVVIIYFTDEQVADLIAQYDALGCTALPSPTATPWPTFTPDASPPAPDNPDSLATLSPGCDAFMPINSSSVMVKFDQDTSLYWQPNADAQTSYMVRRGQSAWMVSEESGFAGIAWACAVVWVPKTAIER